MAVRGDTTAPPLTAADRCDRCGGAAVVRVMLRAGDLLFCERHRKQHADALATAVAIPRKL